MALEILTDDPSTNQTRLENVKHLYEYVYDKTAPPSTDIEPIMPNVVLGKAGTCRLPFIEPTEMPIPRQSPSDK